MAEFHSSVFNRMINAVQKVDNPLSSIRYIRSSLMIKPRIHRIIHSAIQTIIFLTKLNKI